MNSSPALSPNPWAWVIVRPCEIIVAFNANGSLAHSLFSPGNRVLQSVKGPMSYCSAWTNLRLRGKGQRHTALSSPMSTIMSPLRPTVHLQRGASTTQKTRDSITAVAWPDGPVMGVLWHCGQNDRRSGLSYVTAFVWLVTSHDWWSKAFPTLLPSWDCSGIYEENGGRNASGVVGVKRFFWPADNTWQETDRFDMWTCPNLCLRGKGTPRFVLPQTEPVNTVTPHS